MLIIEKRRLIKIAVFLFFITLLIFSFSKFEAKKIAALSDKKTGIIVLDPGHGKYRLCFKKRMVVTVFVCENLLRKWLYNGKFEDNLSFFI